VSIRYNQHQENKKYLIRSGTHQRVLVFLPHDVLSSGDDLQYQLTSNISGVRL
jgi:hypothetical protein